VEIHREHADFAGSRYWSRADCADAVYPAASISRSDSVEVKSQLKTCLGGIGYVVRDRSHVSGASFVLTRLSKCFSQSSQKISERLIKKALIWRWKSVP
jgi:hypothetical protein